MNFTKKHAYTLAEIMLVLLVLSIIFAACAPFFTKRAMKTASGAVWESDRQNTTLNAYSFSGSPDHRGQFFFGISPATEDDIKTAYSPLAKLVIRSGPVISDKVQRQIQFRYKRNSTEDKGDFAGSWLDVNSNMLIGGAYPSISTDVSNGAKNNTSIGYMALNSISTGSTNTAVGYNALAAVSTHKNNTAVGYRAGEKITNKNNTFIGANAGLKATSAAENVYVGYSAGENSTGSNNVFIGAYAGNDNISNNNTAIGYYALKSGGGTENTAIGAYALSNLIAGTGNVAIGYNACGELTSGSYKTCIGANSGPHENTTSTNYLKTKDGGDSHQRTYIGSKPQNFGGDAVLEIHNVGGSNSKLLMHVGRSANTLSNTTTVINGNLIVKGRPYFTVGQNLYHFSDQIYLDNKRGTSAVRYYGATGPGYASCASNQYTYSFSGVCVNLNTTSDRRLKNIGTRSLAGLKELNKLTVYNFTFKNDPKKAPHVGVMAQDLQKVFPNSVFQGEDGYLRIKWDEMFYATINAIKELDKKIVALVKRTTNAETQISKLERENTVLKSQVDSLTARVNKLKAQ